MKIQEGWVPYIAGDGEPAGVRGYLKDEGPGKQVGKAPQLDEETCAKATMTEKAWLHPETPEREGARVTREGGGGRLGGEVVRGQQSWPEKSWSSHQVGCKPNAGFYREKCHNLIDILKGPSGRTIGRGSRECLGTRLLYSLDLHCPYSSHLATCEYLNLN